MFVFEVGVVGVGGRAEAAASAVAAAGVPVRRAVGELGAADFVVVSGVSGLDQAAELLQELDGACPGHAIFAIDSCELPLTELAEATLRPERVIGFHLGDEGSQLVEVAPSEHSEREPIGVAVTFAQAIKRQPVVCAESPGLVVTRILDDAKEIPAGDDATLVAALGVLEEGLATHRDIDVAMARGAGIAPPPLMAADAEGLDVVLGRLGDDAPTILRRLVAQGRTGKDAGQGFYPYPRPDAEDEAVVALETREDVAIAWLRNGAMNSVSPQLVADLGSALDRAEAAGVRALVVASANPFLFSAGADLKAFKTLDEAAGRRFVEDTHALFHRLGEGPLLTVAAVNGLAFGGGNELVMSCDLRIAAESALFGQPEIKLGLIPGFGGTQRLPRLVGASTALELNLIGDPILAEQAYDDGLVTRLVPDHELFDAALAWARKLAEQAPVAAARIRSVSDDADLDAGLTAEIGAFGEILVSEDGREGVSAFFEKRAPSWKGR